MSDQVECYIGCPVDATVLFKIVRREQKAGTFEHDPVALTEATDRFTCAICGNPLQRLDPGAKYLQPVLEAESVKEVAATAAALTRETLVIDAAPVKLA